MPKGYHENHPRASKQHRWKPGGSVASNGYVKIRVGRNHPLADPNGYTYEHLLVWVSAGNERPQKGFIIHHKNEDKTDNRIENLEVMTRAQHNRLHNLERGRCAKTGRLLGTMKAPLLTILLGLSLTAQAQTPVSGEIRGGLIVSHLAATAAKKPASCQISDSLVRQARVLLRRSTELTRTLTVQRDAALRQVQAQRDSALAAHLAYTAAQVEAMGALRARLALLSADLEAAQSATLEAQRAGERLSADLARARRARKGWRLAALLLGASTLSFAIL